MDVLDAPIETITFSVQDVTFLVLGDLSYEQILETARSSKIFVLSEAFWRAKVLRILGLKSMEVGKMYAAQLAKDRDDRIAYFVANASFKGYIPPYTDRNAARHILQAMDGLAAESISACRVPYVRVLYEMNPELLRTQKLGRASTGSGKFNVNQAGEAMRNFLRHSNNLDCVAAYGRLFAQDPFFRKIAATALPQDARNAVGLPGKITQLGNRDLIFADIDAHLSMVSEDLWPQAVEDMFWGGFRNDTVTASDFHQLLQPKYLSLLVKDTEFYERLLRDMSYTETPSIRVKTSMLAGTLITKHRPVHLLLSGTSRIGKSKAKTWLSIGLPQENIIYLQLARVDVTAELSPWFMPLFHSKGHKVRNPKLEQELLTRTFLLCWLDQGNVEHSYRITLRTYQTLCDIIFRPSLHHQTAEYMKSLLASNLGLLQVFELYWMFERDEAMFQYPIGGSTNQEGSRQYALINCQHELENYISRKNDARINEEKAEALLARGKALLATQQAEREAASRARATMRSQGIPVSRSPSPTRM